MTEISKMVEWLTKFIYEYANGDVEFCSKGLAMLRAILAALEPKISRELIEKWLEKNAPLCTCDEAYTGRGLTAPDCLRHRGLDAEDLIRMLKELGLAALATPEPVGEGMKKEMLALIERDIRGARILLPGLDGEDRKSLIREIIVGKAIRALILGNQGGAVTEKK